MLAHDRSPIPAAAFALALLLAGAAASADRVRCPVCGQAFDDSVEICPNDGTDLSLEGVPVDEEEPEGKEADEPAAEEEGDLPAPKYKRHDLGGERKRTDTSEQGDDYSDRKRRIGEERRGPELAAARRRKARARRLRRFAEKDARLRGEFEQRRTEAVADRRRRALDEWRAGRARLARERKALWWGAAPVTSVGVRLAWMGEDGNPGPLAGAEIDFNPLSGVLRAGVSSFVGVRSLPSRGELVFLESISLGVQLPWRFSPYAIARFGIGALVAERFGEQLTSMTRLAGAEAGVDCRVSESLIVTPSLGYARIVVDDAFWDSATLKLSIGF